MHISKPAWIGHLDERQRKVNIFSLDVHPDGSRLVTGGLDTKVKIWSTEVILKHSRVPEPPGALLCTLALHDGAVLCVKWSSKNGQYLATGSDDKIIVIWMLDTLDGAQNLENWKAIKRLVGHESDVADLAWSPDNQYLASCGLDSKVIIWNGQTFEMIKKLEQHQGFVKGIAWDPMGKYLATQSDDKSAIVWRVHDWQIEKTITAPYTKSTSTTFFCRPSWSPDGVQLVTANASNKGVASAAVIHRDTWKNDVHFIGHDAAVEVVRFNPRLFRLPVSKDDDSLVQQSGQIGALCAVGSQDHSVSFWLTARSRSLLVAHDIFTQGVLDIAWSKDGCVVYACSLDGTVAVIQMNEQELGEPLTNHEQEAHFSSLGLQVKSIQLAETPEQLEMEQEHAVTQATQSSNRLAMLMGRSTINDKESVSSGSVPPLQSKAVDTITTMVSTHSGQDTTTAPTQPQRVTITADGRRRIQPQFIRGLTTTASHTAPMHSFPSAPPTPTPPTPGFRNTSSIHSMAMDHAMELAPPSRAMPLSGLETVVVGRKRSVSDVRDAANQGPSKMTSTHSIETRATFLAPELAVSSIRLSIPKVHSVFSRSRVSDQSLVFECHNSIPNQSGASHIICSRQGKILWKQLLSSSTLLLVASSIFSAAACEDGTIHVFSPNGRRLFPCLCLNAPASFLDCNGRYLLCLTSVGQLSIWDIKERLAILSNESIAAILYKESATTANSSDTLSNGVTITDACVHANGTPVLCTSNGCAFAYDQNMKTWSRIVDAWYAASEYFAPVATALNPDVHGGGPLTVAQIIAERTCTDHGRVQRSDQLRSEQQQQALLSIDHLESQLTSAELLASPEEYQRWLLKYVRRLTNDSLIDKTEELCRDLLGPSYPMAVDFTITTTTMNDTSKTTTAKTDSSWEPTICGLKKHELLQTILPIIANNRAMQRIAHEFSDALKHINH
ncbi:WD40-repeat-containing domain protein [Syncephalis fuscata]|nr:WD40-repeat-containing domain protein [Syncephalis fuscata]